MRTAVVGGAPLDLVLPGLTVVAVAAAALSFLLFRRRQLRRAGEDLEREEASLLDIERALLPYTSSGAYLPEGVRRPWDSELDRMTDRSFPALARVFRRGQAGGSRIRVEAAARRVKDLSHQIREHNAEYIQRAVREHSNLLVGELRLDEAQQRATVCGDERNLVVAGAGSGKTRTLIARVRYLIQRQVLPAAILAVTFTNKATEEMEDRLTQMNVPVADRTTDGVTVSTLHALGKRIVQSALSEPISVADDHWTDTLMSSILRDARAAKDPALTQLYLDAIVNFHRREDETAPPLGADLRYRTLRGEHVRSLGERIIADFLLTHHVPYKYEAKASWADVGAGRDAYHPDFTLTETGACIEYWGVNRRGEVPAEWATSTPVYQQHMAWKRAEFKKAGKTLIEFYDYERTEGSLAAALPQRLAAAGVPLSPMSLQELGAVVGDLKYIGSAIEHLLVQFISNARSLRRRPEEIRSRLTRTSPRVLHFGLLGIAVLEHYEAALAEEGRVDFSDMLHRAADILETGKTPLPTFEHILVDEFQDMSAAMARLVKALLAVNRARLFAVGDDWQAIYGFAGGDVDHIVNFEKHFGPASTTMLNVNYRSPAVIVDAGAALIAHNTGQIPKRIVVSSADRGEAYVREVPDDDAELVGATIRLIQEERQRGKPEDILVLSRTNHLLEPILEACRRNRIPVADPDRGITGVRLLSGHKAKGLEAPVVIVVNASDHLLGFPSKVENPDVLEPVRTSSGNEAAEERRLFYVAITRAMKRLYLIVRRGLPSPYIAEIENAKPLASSGARQLDIAQVHIGNRFSAPFHVERLNVLSEKQTAAGIRQAGILATSAGRFAFTSWASFDLVEDGAYWLGNVVKDRPYRDQPRLRLDAGTKAQRQSAASNASSDGSSRELIPRPPADFLPQHPPT